MCVRVKWGKIQSKRVKPNPPKRNVVSSSLAGGAKNDRCKPFFRGLQRFFVVVSFEQPCRSAGTTLYISRCIPANWLRTFFPGLLMEIADLLTRFFRPIFRMGPTPAARPVCWQVPATCGAVPSGPPGPATHSPAPSAPWSLPEGAPSAGQDWRWRKRRPQTSRRSPCGPRPECGHTRW